MQNDAFDEAAWLASLPPEVAEEVRRELDEVSEGIKRSLRELLRQRASEQNPNALPDREDFLLGEQE